MARIKLSKITEPDPAPFKVHLMVRAGRILRARGGPVREFSTKNEAVKFAARQLGGHYAVYRNHKKIWRVPVTRSSPLGRSAGFALHVRPLASGKRKRLSDPSPMFCFLSSARHGADWSAPPRLTARTISKNSGRCALE